MTTVHYLGNATLHLGDCLEILPKLPDNSVDLILTDPPYYKVKSNGWDNQWKSVDEFLGWLDEVLAQFWRVLKPTGSLYLFCSPQLNAEIEMLIKRRFNVLNHCVWAKPSGVFLRHKKEALTRYATKTERIIFAEHYRSGEVGKACGSQHYHHAVEQQKQQTYASLINYFKEAREALSVPAKAINEATGTQMCSHWFSASQWKLPTKEQYETLQALFAEYSQNHKLSRPFDELSKEHQGLTIDYESLRSQYEHLRRPFNVSKEVPFTEVFEYPPVQHYPGKHPCEKPLQMGLDIVKASSRPGDVVLDAFSGSGVFGEAAISSGCKFIGIEFEEESFLKTKDRISNVSSELGGRQERD